MSSFVAMVAAMKRDRDQIGTLKFMAISIFFMLLADQFIFGGTRSYIENNRTQKSEEVVVEEQAPPPVVEAPPVRVDPPEGTHFEAPMIEEPMEEPVVEPDTPPSIPPLTGGGVSVLPKEKKITVQGSPKIAIIIDDVGMDIKHSRGAINLPAPVTMALLPYAPRVREMAKEAKAKGHTLIIHTPMEAMDPNVNIGPGGLKRSMSAEEMKAAFNVMLNSFDGYEGINNHMGSRLTQDTAAMERIMEVLLQKGLFFVDSKTSGRSVAALEAQEAGVPFASRDVFLDHVDSAEFVNKALREAEARAKKYGYAIAIGHPKAHTLAGLNAWIPTLKDKGIELVSVKELLVRPSGHTNVIPAKAGIHGEASALDAQKSGGNMDPRLREGDDRGSGGNGVDSGIERLHFQEPAVAEPAPTSEVFGPLPAEPQIQLHPLPQEWPATLSDTP